MPDKLPSEFTLSGLMEGLSNETVITGSGIEVESGPPSFRLEKGYYEDKETAYLTSVDALDSKPIRQWRWYLKQFVSYHTTPFAIPHFSLANLKLK